MSGYREAGVPDDPLAVDEARCSQQRHREQLRVHLVATVVTMGLWYPVLVGWLVLSSPKIAELARGYRVRVRDGVLVVGNAHSSRSVPLDSIADASLNEGKVTVTVVGGAALVVYGLSDPEAAVDAILQARRGHLDGGRGAARVRVAAPVEPEEEPIEHASRADDRRRTR